MKKQNKGLDQIRQCVCVWWLRLLTSTESKWSRLIMFPSITNMVSVSIPATTCLKSTPILSLSLSLSLGESVEWLNLNLKVKAYLGLRRIFVGTKERECVFVCVYFKSIKWKVLKTRCTETRRRYCIMC